MSILLVGFGQARVANDVSGKDGGQPAFQARN